MRVNANEIYQLVKEIEMSTQIPDNEKKPAEMADLANELGELGKKLRHAVDTAWSSKERQDVQRDVEKGLVKLRDEVNQAINKLRESEPGQKVEAEVKKVSTGIEAGKLADEARKGVVMGLRALGEALDKMADSFTPTDGPSKK